jgi:predicted short-subunit dehydrogenase-like oxidoreductase (DUF2520 family)
MIKVVLIGSGNVAQHLITAFTKNTNSNSKFELVQVFSRNPSQISHLIEQQKITSNYNQLTEADIYIICVSDSSIIEVSNQIPFKNKLVVHTSGSISINELNNSNRKGGFYPLQTFSKNKSIDFKEIPIFIESQNEEDYKLLEEIAYSISNKIYKINSDQRKSLHIAAIFACNFTNHLYQLANDICDENQLPFEVLIPLIQETAEKVKFLSPEQAQTGPAKRNDTATIKSHLDSITNKNQHKIYELLTQSILEHGKKL